MNFVKSVVTIPEWKSKEGQPEGTLAHYMTTNAGLHMFVASSMVLDH